MFNEKLESLGVITRWAGDSMAEKVYNWFITLINVFEYQKNVVCAWIMIYALS